MLVWSFTPQARVCFSAMFSTFSCSSTRWLDQRDNLFDLSLNRVWFVLFLAVLSLLDGKWKM